MSATWQAGKTGAAFSRLHEPVTPDHSSRGRKIESGDVRGELEAQSWCFRCSVRRREMDVGGGRRNDMSMCGANRPFRNWPCWKDVVGWMGSRGRERERESERVSQLADCIERIQNGTGTPSIPPRYTLGMATNTRCKSVGCLDFALVSGPHSRNIRGFFLQAAVVLVVQHWTRAGDATAWQPGQGTKIAFQEVDDSHRPWQW